MHADDGAAHGRPAAYLQRNFDGAKQPGLPHEYLASIAAIDTADDYVSGNLRSMMV